MSKRRKTDWSGERGRKLRAKLGFHENVKCHYCLTAIATTMDHIIPYSRIMDMIDRKIDVGVGWRASVENLVPACYECNHDRDNEMPTCECKKCVSILDRYITLVKANLTRR